MTGPEAPQPDAAEQRLSPTGDAPSADVPEVPLEATDADALEQAADPAPAGSRADREVPLDVPEADAVEQAEVVHLDEDEYR